MNTEAVLPQWNGGYTAGEYRQFLERDNNGHPISIYYIEKDIKYRRGESIFITGSDDIEVGRHYFLPIITNEINADGVRIVRIGKPLGYVNTINKQKEMEAKKIEAIKRANIRNNMKQEL